MKIIANQTVIKDWYGFKASDTKNLLNLHNVFNSGAVDKAVLFPSIEAIAGRSKNICCLWTVSDR